MKLMISLALSIEKLPWNGGFSSVILISLQIHVFFALSEPIKLPDSLQPLTSFNSSRTKVYGVFQNDVLLITLHFL